MTLVLAKYRAFCTYFGHIKKTNYVHWLLMKQTKLVLLFWRIRRLYWSRFFLTISLLSTRTIFLTTFHLSNNILLWRIVMGIFFFVDFRHVKALIFEGIARIISFAIDYFNQSNIFGKLTNIIWIKKGYCSIFRTTNSMSSILLFGHHRVETLFTVSMTTGSE